MISLLVAAIMWWKDVRNLGRDLYRQDLEIADPYGLFHDPQRPWAPDHGP